MKRIIVSFFILVGFAWMNLTTANPVFADTPAQRIPQEQIFLFPNADANTVQLVEILTVNNSSSTSQDIQIFLPDSYKNLHVTGYTLSAADVRKNRVVLHRSAKPRATTTIVAAYTATFSDGQAMQLNLRSFYPVDIAQLYLPVSGHVALSAEGVLANSNQVMVEGKTFRVFTRPGLFDHTDWHVGLQPLPAGNAATFTKGLPVIGQVGNLNLVESIANLILIIAVLWVTVFRSQRV